LGELQHGVYDDECKGLTGEEINAFYDFDNDSDGLADSDKTDSDKDSVEYDDRHLEEPNVDEEQNLNGPGSEDDHDDVIILPFIIQ
jgi:hypothetical protein